MVATYKTKLTAAEKKEIKIKELMDIRGGTSKTIIN